MGWGHSNLVSFSANNRCIDYLEALLKLHTLVACTTYLYFIPTFDHILIDHELSWRIEEFPVSNLNITKDKHK